MLEVVEQRVCAGLCAANNNNNNTDLLLFISQARLFLCPLSDIFQTAINEKTTSLVNVSGRYSESSKSF